MAVLCCEVLVSRQEGGLANQQVDMLCQLDGALAPRGVHNERERLSRSRLADIFKADHPSFDIELSRCFQTTDIRSRHPECGETFGNHPSVVGLLQSPAQCVDAMTQWRTAEAVTIADVNDTGDADRMPFDGNVLLSCGCVTQPIEVLLSAGRIVHRNWKLTMVERDAHDHPGQAQTMITVKVGDADPRD